MNPSDIKYWYKKGHGVLIDSHNFGEPKEWEEKMKPNRKLDAEVAEKIMGWVEIEWVTEDGSGYRDVYGKPPHNTTAKHKMLIPKYSTDFSSAWEVLNQIRDGLKQYGFWHKDTSVELWKSPMNPDDRMMMAQGESVAHVICITALKLMEGK